MKDVYGVAKMPVYLSFADQQATGNDSLMKHLRCRCLGGMTHYPQTQLSTIPQTQQLQMHVYRISVQQSQCSALVMQSEANQC